MVDETLEVFTDLGGKSPCNRRDGNMNRSPVGLRRAYRRQLTDLHYGSIGWVRARNRRHQFGVAADVRLVRLADSRCGYKVDPVRRIGMVLSASRSGCLEASAASLLVGMVNFWERSEVKCSVVLPAAPLAGGLRGVAGAVCPCHRCGGGLYGRARRAVVGWGATGWAFPNLGSGAGALSRACGAIPFWCRPCRGAVSRCRRGMTR